MTMAGLLERRRRTLASVLACRRGAAMVEFALVAAPFMFFLFAIIEMGLIFVANINLSNATLALSRQIRVGAVVAPGSSATTSNGAALTVGDFKTAVCKNFKMVSAATCNAQLQVDVRTHNSFAGQTNPNPMTGTNFNNASLCYYSGAGGSIVVFRAFYLWPISTPLLLTALANATSYTSGGTTSSGSYYVLKSTEVFRIEQNSAGANTGSGC